MTHSSGHHRAAGAFNGKHFSWMKAPWNGKPLSLNTTVERIFSIPSPSVFIGGKDITDKVTRYERKTRWWRRPLNLPCHQSSDMYRLGNLCRAAPCRVFDYACRRIFVRATCREGGVGGDGGGEGDGKTKLNICWAGCKSVLNWSAPPAGDGLPAPATPGTRSATLRPAGWGVENQINNCGKGKNCVLPPAGCLCLPVIIHARAPRMPCVITS